MKISLFIFIRNGTFFDYSFIESVHSVLRHFTQIQHANPLLSVMSSST